MDSIFVKNNLERQDWDLNPEFQKEQDFQSCAIPGYAILALILNNKIQIDSDNYNIEYTFKKLIVRLLSHKKE